MKYVLNPLSGFFDIVGDSGTPTGGDSGTVWNTIPPGQTLAVAQFRTLLAHNLIDNQELISLELDSMVDIFESEVGYGFPILIRPNQTVDVPANNQVVVHDLIDNQGLIENYSQIIIE